MKRKRGGLSMALWGRHAVAAAIANPDRRIDSLFCVAAAEAEMSAAVAAAGRRRPAPVVLSGPALLRHVPDQAVHQGHVAIVRPLPSPSVDELAGGSDPVLVILDQVTDPGNAGAVLRSAAAFGAAGLVMQQRHAPPVDGVLAKAASGALERLPVATVTNLARAMDRLKARGVWCVGLSGSAAADIADLRLDGPVALVLGAEGAGLRRLTRERCDAMVRLPTDPSFPELNVSNAAAIGLYELRRRR